MINKKLLNIVRKLLDGLYLGCAVIAALSLVGIAVLVTGQIIARFFHTNIPSSDDISGYMVAWATFMGLAYAMSKNDHIRVDLFINMLPWGLKKYFIVIVSGIGFVLMTLFSYYVFQTVLESYHYGDVTSGHIAMPLWVVQTPFFIGILVFLIAILDRLLTNISTHPKEVQ